MTTALSKTQQLVEVEAQVAGAFLTARQNAAEKLLASFVAKNDLVGTCHMLYHPDIDVEKINASNKRSLLLSAVNHGNIEMFRRLFEKGIKPKSDDDLIAAAARRIDAKIFDPILKLIIEKGFYTENQLSQSLDTVITNGRSNALDILLSNNADPETTNFNTIISGVYDEHTHHTIKPAIYARLSMLSYALFRKNPAAVKILLKHKADAFKKDDSGNSPFDYASATGLGNSNFTIPQDLKAASLFIGTLDDSDKADQVVMDLQKKQSLIAQTKVRSTDVPYDARQIRDLLKIVTGLDKTTRALARLEKAVEAKRPGLQTNNSHLAPEAA